MPTEQLLELAGLLKPLNVIEYAKAKHWEIVEGVTRPIFLLRHETETLHQIQIPKDSKTDDFADAMLTVACRLAEFEARPALAVLNDLLAPGVDILRFRVSGSKTANGTLSLERGIQLLKGAKYTLLSAAHDVLVPNSKHHPRLGRKEAMGLLEACQLGQTERGSYVVSVACPLDYDDGDPQMQLFESNIPLGRSTAQGVMKSAAVLVDVIDNSKELDLENPAVCSNFCKALLDMQPGFEDGSLSISVTWSPTHPLEEGVSVPSEVTFPQEYFSSIEKCYGLLSPSREESRKALFVGTVESLGGDDFADRRRYGDVTFRLFDEEDNFTAKASLSADDYAIADQAHMSENHLVRFEAVLCRRLRIHQLEEISEFKLINREDNEGTPSSH